MNDICNQIHPRCECHDCTQFRAAEKGLGIGGLTYVQSTPRCQACGLPMFQPETHGFGKCVTAQH